MTIATEGKGSVEAPATPAAPAPAAAAPVVATPAPAAAAATPAAATPAATPPAAVDATAEAKAAAAATPADTAAKTEADKKAAEAAAQKRAPEKYELKAPEGTTLAADAVAAIESLARDLDLTQEQAQKLAEHQAKAEVDAVAAGQAQLKAATEAWGKTVEADKDLGGANFEQTKELCRRAIDKVGDEELKKALDDTGYGNFPPLVRMLRRVGQLMAEDKIDAPAGAANPAKRVEDLLYDAPVKT